MNAKHKDKPTIAKKVFIAKFFPICFIPKIIKGIFIAKINKEIESIVKWEIKREIPVTPPSIKPLGIKKLFIPNPAEKIPNKINKRSLMELKKSFKINLFCI